MLKKQTDQTKIEEDWSVALSELDSDGRSDNSSEGHLLGEITHSASKRRAEESSQSASKNHQDLSRLSRDSDEERYIQRRMSHLPKSIQRKTRFGNPNEVRMPSREGMWA